MLEGVGSVEDLAVDVIVFFCRRKGFDEWWDPIDPEIRLRTRARWKQNLIAELKRKGVL